MVWDPSITQRVYKAIGDATDQHLITDLLLKLIKEQEEKIVELDRKVLLLKNAEIRRFTKKECETMVDAATRLMAVRVASLKWITIGAIIVFVVGIFGDIWATRHGVK